MDNLIIFGAKYLIVFIALIVAAVFYYIPKNQRKKFALTVVLAGLAAVILAKICGKIYFHPRPFVVDGIVPLVSHGADNGFPSEHSVLAATLATAVYFYKRNIGLALLGMAILVGVARVGAHVHSWLDIFAGLFIGILAGYVGYTLAQKILLKKHETHSSK
jgi:undecaprenyl-diphosphatase